MNLLDELAVAAKRGVDVVILTNDDPEPPLTLKWTFKEHRDGTTASYRAGSYDLHVIDCDGDMSEWVLQRGKTVIAEGGTYACEPFYHFDNCLIAAEAALRLEVRRRKAEIEAMKVAGHLLDGVEHLAVPEVTR